MEVECPVGQVTGYVEQTLSLCTPTSHINDAEGNEKFPVEGTRRPSLMSPPGPVLPVLLQVGVRVLQDQGRHLQDHQLGDRQGGDTPLAPQSSIFTTSSVGASARSGTVC